MNFLSADVGTTGCKVQLFDASGAILEYFFEEYDFKYIDGEKYVNIETICSCLETMISKIGQKYEIASVCISSLGESFVLLDEQDHILFYPMLYTDHRGEKEAEVAAETIGESELFRVTGVTPHSMYSIYKLLWIRNNYPELFQKADKVLLIGEYIGYLLTGKRCIDYSLASRTGVFDIEELCFSEKLLEKFSVPKKLFSEPHRAGTIVAPIKENVIRRLKIKGNPVLVLGAHDQVCAALGAGVIEEGDAVDGMGTVECITTLFSEKSDDERMGKQGFPCVPYALEGLYCTYMLNYSCGSAVNWLRKKIMHNYKDDADGFFDYIEEKMPKDATGIFVLPYFGGAATPYQDSDAKGAIVNLTSDTEDAVLYKALLEGMAMEMKLNGEIVRDYGIRVRKVVAAGGGANSETWLQIKADIQNLPVKMLRSSEGGLCGCAMLSAVALKAVADMKSAKQVFVRYTKEFTPRADQNQRYEKLYQKYKKMYGVLKEFN